MGRVGRIQWKNCHRAAGNSKDDGWSGGLLRPSQLRGEEMHRASGLKRPDAADRPERYVASPRGTMVRRPRRADAAGLAEPLVLFARIATNGLRVPNYIIQLLICAIRHE